MRLQVELKQYLHFYLREKEELLTTGEIWVKNPSSISSYFRHIINNLKDIYIYFSLRRNIEDFQDWEYPEGKFLLEIGEFQPRTEKENIDESKSLIIKYEAIQNTVL